MSPLQSRHKIVDRQKHWSKRAGEVSQNVFLTLTLCRCKHFGINSGNRYIQDQREQHSEAA